MATACQHQLYRVLFSLLIRASVGFLLAEGISQLKWQWFKKPRKLKDMEVFDSASSSAWGSVLLVIRFSPKRPYFVAVLGAFITLMASLTGFTAQQLVQFQDCLQPDMTASVGVYKTNRYGFTNISFLTGNNSAFRSVLAAIDVALIQPIQDLTSVLSTGCTMGNCSFPSTGGASFSSLGFSYECENHTSSVQDFDRNGTAITNNTHNYTEWANLTDAGNGYSPVGLHMSIRSDVMATGADVSIPNSVGAIRTIFKRSLRSADYEAIRCSIIPSINIDAVPKTGNGMMTYPSNTSWYYPQDCVWMFSWNTAMTMKRFLEEVFELQHLYMVERGNTEYAVQGPAHLRSLYREGNIIIETMRDYMKGLTAAMSTAVRTGGDEGPAWRANGTMWYTTTCLRVNWWWVTFPASMIG